MADIRTRAWVGSLAVSLAFLAGGLHRNAFADEVMENAPLESLLPVELEFLLALGPKCLNGAFPLTLKTTSGTIDEQQAPDKADLKIEAMANAEGPAFNIFDVGIDGANTMRLITGSRPPRLKWR